jgi:hypothetical protein
MGLPRVHQQAKLKILLPPPRQQIPAQSKKFNVPLSTRRRVFNQTPKLLSKYLVYVNCLFRIGMGFFSQGLTQVFALQPEIFLFQKPSKTTDFFKICQQFSS